MRVSVFNIVQKRLANLEAKMQKREVLIVARLKECVLDIVEEHVDLVAFARCVAEAV